MYLFRTEEFSGEGVREIQSVIAFETGVLGNTDIWDYCTEHYHLSDRTNELVRELLAQLETEEDVSEFLDVAINSLLDDLESELGKRLSYCLWLASYEDVKYYYGTPTTAAQPSDVILSDLGCEGCLYGYVEQPEEVELSELSVELSEQYAISVR